MINTLKNEMWQKKCSNINCYLGSTRSSEAWKTLKGLRKDTQERSNMSLITMEEWENYYKTLLTEERAEFLETEQHENTNDQQVTEITSQEVYRAVKGMKNNKAAGPGGLQIELIKNAPSGVYEILARIYNKCLQGEETPQEWKKAYITSIYKKGDRRKCENYRGISITSSIGRLYGRILKTRMEEIIQDAEEQSGFCAGRSCIDNIFCLKQLCKKKRKLWDGNQLHICGSTESIRHYTYS
jgi:helix-turn-helix protein